jgi:hypothetical protein
MANAHGVRAHTVRPWRSIMRCESRGMPEQVVVTAAVGTQITTNATGDPLCLSGIGPMEIGAHTSGLRLVRVGSVGIFHAWLTISELEQATDRTVRWAHLRRPCTCSCLSASQSLPLRSRVCVCEARAE